MPKSVVTKIAIKKMLEARAGIKSLPPIAGMAFGNGAVRDGIVQKPSSAHPELQNELYRQVIDGYSVLSDTRIRYSCTLAKETLEDVNINEIALFDTEGDLVAIKSFRDKGKDGDMEMVFDVDDTFYDEEDEDVEKA